MVVDAGLGLRGMRTALRSAGPQYVIAIPKGLAAVRTMGLTAQHICVGDLPDTARRVLGVSATLAEIEALGSDSPLPEPRRTTPKLRSPSPPVRPARRRVCSTCTASCRPNATPWRISTTSPTTTGSSRPSESSPCSVRPGHLLGGSGHGPDRTGDADGHGTGRGCRCRGRDPGVRFAGRLGQRGETRSEVPSRCREALAGVRLLLSTGAPVPPELLREVLQMMPSAQAHARTA